MFLLDERVPKVYFICAILSQREVSTRMSPELSVTENFGVGVWRLL